MSIYIDLIPVSNPYFTFPNYVKSLNLNVKKVGLHGMLGMGSFDVVN